MSKIVNIYCDESCHLEHDHLPIMLFGAVWCPQEETKQHIAALRELKERHRARGELKWTKVSEFRKLFFFETVALHQLISISDASLSTIKQSWIMDITIKGAMILFTTKCIITWIQRGDGRIWEFR